MALPVTPSSSFRSAGAMDQRRQDDDLAGAKDGDVISKNRLVILELEEKYILTPGVLTVTPSGQLEADLSREEPDQGTTVGLYPALPPPEGYETQIPSWLRDYLVKELDLFGSGPPSACGSLYDQMKRSSEVGREGTNLSVNSASLLLRCGIASLRDAVTDLREFCTSGEPVCEETYAMDFGIVESVIKKLASWDPSQSVQNRLLATRPTKHGSKGHSPAKRRKVSKRSHVEVAAPAARELPKDIQLLLDLGSQGMVMKGCLDSSLEGVIIDPVSRLVDKLEIVERGLREDEVQERKKEEHRMGGDNSSDSGVSACSP